jgi:16S rRNA (guanine527-N7)-methyltransferase
MVIELFLDSLIPLPYIRREGILLDVGPGAGFPGLPLKICRPGLEVHLIEANSKKVSFLKQMVRLLQLKDVHIFQGRIEKEGARILPGPYTMITARALAELDKTLGWCAPYLAPEGFLICFLGDVDEGGLQRHREILDTHRLEPHRHIPYLLPEKQKKRHVVIFRKEA